MKARYAIVLDVNDDYATYRYTASIGSSTLPEAKTFSANSISMLLKKAAECIATEEERLFDIALKTRDK